MKMSHVAAAVVVALSLAACGGGGSSPASSANPQPQPQQPQQPEPQPQNPAPAPVPLPGEPGSVSLSFATKRITLSWQPATDATSYHVLVKSDANSEFRVLGGTPVSKTSFDIAIASHLLNWYDVRYRVDACNDTGCTPSKEQAVFPFLAQETIGYFKPFYIDAGDQFGYSVALSADGGTLAIGAPMNDGNAFEDLQANDDSVHESGAVYVFTRDDTDSSQWHITTLLKAPNADADDRFGASVALSGDGKTIVVGAAGEDSSAIGVDGNPVDNSAADAGAAYVFRLSANKWQLQAYLKASNTEAGDAFGSTLALSGDGNILAVAAPAEDSSDDGIDGNQVTNLAKDAGAVYLFTRTGLTWAQSVYVKASNSGAGHGFGTGLAMSRDGHAFVASSPGEGSGGIGVNALQSGNTRPGSGSAYAFRFDNGQWSQQAYFKASRAIADLDFGEALAMSGDGLTIAVGAPLESSDSHGVDGNQDSTAAKQSGAVYVFGFDSHDGWLQQGYLKGTASETNDQFGSALALSEDGNVLAIGAPLEDGGGIGLADNQVDNSVQNAGAAYAYTRDGAKWKYGNYLKSSASTPTDFFGRSLALSADGQSLVVGVSDDSGKPSELTSVAVGDLANDDTKPAAGAVYLF